MRVTGNQASEQACRQKAAIDRERLTRDVRRMFTAQKRHRFRDLIRFAIAPGGNRAQGLRPRIGRMMRALEGGIDRPGSDTACGNPCAGQLVAICRVKAPNTAFGVP